MTTAEPFIADGWAPGMHPRDVVRIYETLLGRTPGPEEIQAQRAATTDWRVLLAAVAGSDEFRRRHGAGGLELPPARANIWAPGTAGFGHPVGTPSTDGDAVVGHEGWVFLARGSNSVIEQYQDGFALPEGWAEEWVRALDVRRDEAATIGASLTSVIVPDKLSVIDAMLPPELALTARPPASVLVDDLGLDVLYPVDALRTVEQPFLRGDTHLSLKGNRELALVVLRAIPGVDPEPALHDHGATRYASYGDLGRRFEPPIVEIVETAGSMGDATVVADNREEMAAQGRHIGTRTVLSNGGAPDARTVVVFGDSYSMAAPHYQGLSWFLAQVFVEVHFIWSPFGWDLRYAEGVGADVIVCEMAERFVPRPPALRVTVDALGA